MNYEHNQERHKIGLEGHSQIPSQHSYPTGQPPNSPGQPPYPASHPHNAPSPPPMYTSSQYPHPSQQSYPSSVHQGYQQPAYAQSQPGYTQPGYLQPGYGYNQPGYIHQNFPQQFPITNQPMGQAAPNWMQKPDAIPNCPPGLEYLASIDKLLVHQELDLLEMITGFEIENKYSIHNTLGQMVYHATEESGACIRNCCGSARPFEMKINDHFGQEVIHLSRPCKCQCCCCFCCLQTMEVSSPPGVVIGTIEQNWNPIFPTFSIKNPVGDDVLQIKGPFCTTAACTCADVEFEVFYGNGGASIGKITKKWGGYLREAYTNADNFGISFPEDLDVKMKAVLVGALFLIDMMYFEQRQNTQRR